MEHIQQFAREYADAWSSQNPESVAGCFSEMGSLKVNDSETAVGRSAIAELTRGFMSIFPDMVVTLDELVSASEGTECHWTLTGTNSGPDGTGNRIRISGYELWQIGADGLIAESKGSFDVGEYTRQLEAGFAE